MKWSISVGTFVILRLFTRKKVEKENTRLRKLIVDLSLDKAILKEVI